MRRALTMVELLLALSLLSMVMLAIVSWTQTTIRASAGLAAPSRWQAVAQAVLELVHDDLLIGDFVPNQAREDKNKRVHVIDGTLRISTRDEGAIEHDYVFDVQRHELVLKSLDKTGRSNTHLLLAAVDQWEFVLDDEKRILTVVITSIDGKSLARNYLSP